MGPYAGIIILCGSWLNRKNIWITDDEYHSCGLLDDEELLFD